MAGLSAAPGTKEDFMKHKLLATLLLVSSFASAQTWAGPPMPPEPSTHHSHKKLIVISALVAVGGITAAALLNGQNSNAIHFPMAKGGPVPFVPVKH